MNISVWFHRLPCVKNAIKGGVSCIASLGLLFLALFPRVVVTDFANVQERLDGMPDYNYLSEIRSLAKDGNLLEAEQLADFVLESSSVEGREDVEKERKAIHQKRTAACERIRRAIKGFATGEGHSMEELGGSIASDMFLYGDIRDLCKQGYYKVTDQTNKVDVVVAALAGVGVATELVDAADWAPAVLKMFRKVGALSSKFCDFIVSACKKTVKARKMDKELTAVFKGTKTLCDGVGTARAARIMKHVDNVDDLKAVARIAEKSPEAVTAIVRFQGKEGLELAKTLSKEADGAEILTKAVRKGPAGMDLLKRGAKSIRFYSRTAKIGWKGQFFGFLSKLLPLEWIRGLFAAFAAMFGAHSYFHFRKVKTA